LQPKPTDHRSGLKEFIDVNFGLAKNRAQRPFGHIAGMMRNRKTDCELREWISPTAISLKRRPATSDARTRRYFEPADASSLYSKISPGWHSRALQIASRVDSRIAFALPFFRTETLAIVMPTFSASSVTLVFRFANMTSMFMMIAMLVSLYR
jgi:hypothetical protein